MKELKNSRIALLLISCDKYADLWPMFINFFKKNWSECDYDKFILTNNETVIDSSFKTLKIGEDQGWSNSLMKALDLLKMNYDYVLVTLEDSPIIEKVNHSKFQTIINSFLEINGNYLKFITKPRPTSGYNKHFGVIGSGSLYRPTCVYALYRIKVLIDLMNSEENAWQFERFGAVRSDIYDKFFVVNEDFFKISNTVVKGKWVGKEYKKILKLGFAPDLSERKLLNRQEEILLLVKTIIYKLFMKVIPWKWRRSLVFRMKGYAS